MTTSEDAIRIAEHHALSTTLALQSDSALRALAGTARKTNSGIGGRTAVLEVAGKPVFMKRIPLTEVELDAANAHSTANVFDVPTSCHYGLGSPGFGAWRELAVQVMTTNWALEGEYTGFPLLHHSRVLPEAAAEVVLPDDLADVEKAVAAWGGAPQVRRRIEELAKAPASLALFMESFPQNLHQWMGEQVAAGEAAVERACAMVERELAAGIGFMNARGLLHFDAHFENMMTDGRRLFFTDYGLALSDRFELTPGEAEFFRRHESYDRTYAANYMVKWLVTEFYGLRGAEREAFVRACAEGRRLTGIPPAAAAIVARDAPVAVVMEDFIGKVQREGPQTPYPFG